MISRNRITGCNDTKGSKVAVSARRRKTGWRLRPDARSKWPERRIVKILRDPVARLRSVMQHFYGRRNVSRYHRLGHIIAAMYQDRLEVDPHLLDHPLMRHQCDNVMVRYLSSVAAYDRVTEAHLAEAVENLAQIDVPILNEQFADGAQRLFARLGRDCPPPRRENPRIVEDRLFEELPDGFEPYVRLDSELIAAARARLASGT